MDLKNITMSDLKAKFSGAADKKTLIKFGIGFGAIIIFLIIRKLLTMKLMTSKSSRIIITKV